MKNAKPEQKQNIYKSLRIFPFQKIHVGDVDKIHIPMKIVSIQIPYVIIVNQKAILKRPV